MKTILVTNCESPIGQKIQRTRKLYNAYFVFFIPSMVNLSDYGDTYFILKEMKPDIIIHLSNENILKAANKSGVQILLGTEIMDYALFRQMYNREYYHLKEDRLFTFMEKYLH